MLEEEIKDTKEEEEIKDTKEEEEIKDTKKVALIIPANTNYEWFVKYFKEYLQYIKKEYLENTSKNIKGNTKESDNKSNDDTEKKLKIVILDTIETSKNVCIKVEDTDLKLIYEKDDSTIERTVMEIPNSLVIEVSRLVIYTTNEDSSIEHSFRVIIDVISENIDLVGKDNVLIDVTGGLREYIVSLYFASRLLKITNTFIAKVDKKDKKVQLIPIRLNDEDILKQLFQAGELEIIYYLEEIEKTIEGKKNKIEKTLIQSMYEIIQKSIKNYLQGEYDLSILLNAMWLDTWYKYFINWTENIANKLSQNNNCKKMDTIKGQLIKTCQINIKQLESNCTKLDTKDIYNIISAMLMCSTYKYIKNLRNIVAHNSENNYIITSDDARGVIIMTIRLFKQMFQNKDFYEHIISNKIEDNGNIGEIEKSQDISAQE